MSQNVSSYTAAMSPQQSAWFTAEYEAVRKDEITGALLAFFLGTFGAHHFYLNKTKLGILYAVFFWTGIPSVCGFVECFLMPGRVRAYNFTHANGMASRISAAPASVTVNSVGAHTSPNVCNACGQELDGAAVFCTRCGASVTNGQPSPVSP